MAELGTRDVGLIGGEAYLRKDWLEIVAAVRAAGMECGLQTGGRNLNEERHRQGGRRRACRASACRSTASRDVHDELRGVPGSFELALAALRRRRAHGMVGHASTPRSTPARCRSCAS